MKRLQSDLARILRCTAGACLVVGTADAQPLTYPTTPRGEVVETLHGVQVEDPYRWLEAPEADNVQAWIEAQDSLARSVLDTPLREGILRQLEAFHLQARVYPSVLAGGRRFTPSVSARGLSIQVRDADASAPRDLVPAADVPPRTALVEYLPSPDGDVLAVAWRTLPARWVHWTFHRAADGQALPDTLGGALFGASHLAWSPDGDGVFYSAYEREDGQPTRAQVRYHRLGEEPDADEVVYAPDTGTLWTLDVDVTDDGRHLVLTGREGSSLKSTVAVRRLGDPESDPIVLRDADASYDFVGGTGSHLWFRTDLDAPNGRLVEIDLSRPERENWREIVPEADDVLMGYAGGGGGLALPLVVGDRLVLPYLRDTQTVLRVHDLDGRLVHEADVPPGGSLFHGGGGNPLVAGDGAVTYRYLGITDPNAVFRLDLATGRTEAVRRPALPFDPADFVTERVSYASADGTRVPLSLTRRADVAPDGTNPAWLMAYGSSGFSLAPYYQSRLMLWLEWGGVVAVAAIRGGGEYGETWYRGGSGLDKQNGIDDVLGAAEWLVEAGWTRADRLALNGVSAGGLLPAAALAQRPDAFGAALPEYPLADMLRYEALDSWSADEYGSVADPEAFAALRAYSPVHNLEAGACYPPTLVLASDADDVVQPAHAYKLVAALQHAQACDAPALLQMAWGSPHAAYGSTRNAALSAFADQLAFLATAFDLAPVR